jgi:hypothetical protein
LTVSVKRQGVAKDGTAHLEAVERAISVEN